MQNNNNEVIQYISSVLGSYANDGNRRSAKAKLLSKRNSLQRRATCLSLSERLRVFNEIKTLEDFMQKI